MNAVARRLIPLSRIFQSRASFLPGLRAGVANASRASIADRFFFQWLAFTGLMVFASFILWRANVWGVLIEADPTGITMMILGVFVLSTIWVGRRAWVMMRERSALDAWIQSVRPQFGPAQAPTGHVGAVNDYFSALMEKARRHDYDNGQLTEVLAERMHGPSESAWWINGIQIKMGLLGKVIGFSILALDISQMQTFDASQSATMLKTLTGGLGIALLTTAVGLMANMLLGAQLVRMDRCSDGILADSLEFAETHLAKLTHQEAK